MPSQYYVILKLKKPVNKNKFKFLGRMNNLISFIYLSTLIFLSIVYSQTLSYVGVFNPHYHVNYKWWYKLQSQHSKGQS